MTVKLSDAQAGSLRAEDMMKKPLPQALWRVSPGTLSEQTSETLDVPELSEVGYLSIVRIARYHMVMVQLVDSQADALSRRYNEKNASRSALVSH